MMKKHGFTLAEVLITLGIIGVVAALTMPTFTAKTQTAKIGPSLAKASAAFAESSKAMMAHYEADSLSSMYFCNDGNLSCSSTNKILYSDNSNSDGQKFWDAYANFMNGSKIAPANIGSGDGPGTSNTVYGFQSADGTIFWLKDFTSTFSNNAPNKSKYGAQLVVDINGAKEPNKWARDRFVFYLLDNGTLLPFGSSSSIADSSQIWTSKCPKDAAPTNGQSCTGHIFENGFKVEYK